jgi:hypothetical protein
LYALAKVRNAAKIVAKIETMEAMRRVMGMGVVYQIGCESASGGEKEIKNLSLPPWG